MELNPQTAFLVLLSAGVVLYSIYLLKQNRSAALPEPEQDLEEESEEEIPTDGIHIGTRLDGARQPMFLPQQLRSRHCYLIGKSGTGKTTLIKTMISEELTRGSSFCFIDPHGDAALELLGNVPRERIADVIYFDPTATNAPAFNPFRLPYPPAKLTSDLVSAFKMLYGDSWGFRMEHLLNSSILTLLTDTEPHTINDLRRLLINADYRQEITDRITDEQMQEFWNHEFPQDTKGSVPAVTNKLSQILMPTSHLQRVFSARENEINFPDVMNNGRILIANLAKGALGDEGSRLLGAFLTTGIQQAALARAEIPEEKRKDFSFFVDEFQNYQVSSFETILSEARKYRLNLTLAHQNLGQLPSSLQRSIFGNVATLIAFQVSADDAPHLRKEMHRSKLSVQIPSTPDTVTLAAFVAHQKKLLQEALLDRNLGRTREELAKRKREANRAADVGFAASVSGGLARGREDQERREEITQRLETLDRRDLDANTLRDLFPNYRFREESFPNTDDFLSLTPHHAFCRMERADNVFPFKSLFPPKPDEEIRNQILNREPSKREPPPQAPAAEKPPTTDDDFRF